jgi:integrase/recombinase XerD
MALDSLRATMLSHLESLATRNYSPSTVSTRARDFRLFVVWCEERALTRPHDVTRPLLERYQRHLFYVRKPNGHALSMQRQSVLLVHLRLYFRWLCRQGLLPANPAADLLLPRLGTRLPFDALSAQDVERLLATPDVATLVGLRDRAILELMWATGLRRSEVAHLDLSDVREERGTLFVRQGKGKKDRVVPLAPRVFEWLERYLCDVRPRYIGTVDEGALFLAESGLRLAPDALTHRVRQLLASSGFKGRGSCHLLRHACATALLEGGADVRFVQELLGHTSLETTQLYTHVTITKLKAVYAACHPAARTTTAAPTPAADTTTVSASDVLQELALEASDDE